MRQVRQKLRSIGVGEITCTKDDPWTEARRPASGERIRIAHPDAHEIGEQQNGYPAGDIVTMECPNCKVRWEQELPQ